MRAYNELHPKDRLTLEHIHRAGLDELEPDSALNVNSRVASLAHYYVEFRGRSSLLDPSHPRYRAETARKACQQQYAKHRAGLAVSKPAEADLKRPARMWPCSDTAAFLSF